MTRTYSLGISVSRVLAILPLTTVSHSQTAPSKPKTAVPVTMTECEGTNNCATWTFLGAQGNGQWPSGEVANLSVERYDANSVVIGRADSTGSSAGLTAVYTAYATTIALEENIRRPGRGTGTATPATGRQPWKGIPPALPA